MWVNVSCSSAAVESICLYNVWFVVCCAGRSEKLRYSAWMAVQEWRAAAAAEDGLWDCCWTYSHAQAQLPAQVIFLFLTHSHSQKTHTTCGTMKRHRQVTFLLHIFHGILTFLKKKNPKQTKRLISIKGIVSHKFLPSMVSCESKAGAFACSEYMQRSPITQLLGIAGCRLSFCTETWWFCDLSVNRSLLYFAGVCMLGHGCIHYNLSQRLFEI